ncbi:4Fe-4S binding protein [Holdemanella biformis]
MVSFERVFVTPVIIIYGECILCCKCVEVCPKHALHIKK